MNTSMDSLSIEIESVAKDSNTAVDLLITKLDKLRTSLQNVLKESDKFSKLKTDISGATKNVRDNAGTKASSSNNGYGSYHEQLYKLGIGDLGDSNYAKLKSTVQTTNSEISKFVTKNNEIVTVSKSVKNGVDNVKVSVKTLGTESKNTTGLWSALTSEFAKSVAKISAVYVGLRKLASVIAKYTKEAANYEESLNLFTVTMGENAKQGLEWVTKFSDALYLDPAGVMQYMGQFNSLTKGLGVGADKAYIMSKNLTQLTYDLASFKNLDIDTAFRKLQSAMSGEIEPLRNVGVALSQNTLQELANSMGIEQRVADMDEASKAQLRYIQILRSTSDWQTDMARTLVTPANALRILQQQFTLLARAIGSVFIPIVMEIIPYVMVLTRALTALAQRLADLLGYKIADIDYSYISGGLGGIADGIEDIGNNASGTAKKLNTMLAPFDELNVVQKEVEKSGRGSGTDSGLAGIDLPLPEYDALAGLTNKLEEKMDDAKKKLQEFGPILLGIGGAFAAWKIGSSVADFMTWWDNLTGGGKTAAKIGLSIGLMFLGYQFIKSGMGDTLNEETLLKGVGKEVFGSSAFGIAAGMLTKSVPVGIFVGLSLLGFSGAETGSHGDWENGISGFLEQGVSIAGITGLGFKLSGGNPVITLAVAALVTWANVFFDLAKLAELKPTWEELYNAIFVELNPFHDLSESLADFLYDLPNASDVFTDFGNKLGDAASDLADSVGDSWENLKTDTSNKWDDIKTDISNKWDDMKKSISTKVDDIKTNVGNKWNDLKTDTSTKWDDIKSDFSTKLDDMKTAASERFDSIKTTITEKWTNAKDWLTKNIGTKKDWKDKFKGILDGAGNILDDLKNKFSNWKATLKMPHISWDSNGWQATGTLKKVLETLHLPTALPKINVSWYAEGGFPRDGDFFVANENGPEMIGRIGNRSAVANNEQITESITNALITALDNYDFGGGKSPTTIYIGNKKVYEGYGDYANSESDRYGTNTIRI